MRVHAPILALTTILLLFLVEQTNSQEHSEEAAATNEPIAYTVLQGESFMQRVKVENTPGNLVFFGAEWCIHCKKFKPTFQALAKKFKEEKFVLNPEFIFYPSDTKDVTMKTMRVKGYPTIMFVKEGKYWEYEGARNETELINFIESFAVARADGKVIPDAPATFWEDIQESMEDVAKMVRFQFAHNTLVATVFAVILGGLLLLIIFAVYTVWTEPSEEEYSRRLEQEAEKRREARSAQSRKEK